jgi:hypothetical protein
MRTISNGEIAHMRASGMTYAEIAKKAGVSYQRIHQIIAKPHYLPTLILPPAEQWVPSLIKR